MRSQVSPMSCDSIQELIARVDRLVVEVRDDDRRHPFAAERRFVRADVRPDRRHLLAGAAAASLRRRRAGGRNHVAREVAVEPVRVDDGRVRRIDREVGPLAAGHRLPGERLQVVAAVAEVKGHAVAARVLNRPVGVERRIVVHLDVVELRQVDLRERAPVRAAVLGHPEAAVVAVVDDLRIVRIDPEPVVVAVRRVHAGERRAAVVRHVDAQPEGVDRVRILRIDADLREHPAVGVRLPHHELRGLRREAAHLLPVRAAVVRAVHLGASMMELFSGSGRS